MRDISELMQNDIFFGICMCLLAILIVCRVAWWAYSNILERQLNINKGIPVTDYTAEEVEVIVRKNLVCPFVKEIGEDKQDGMFFQCENERYFLKMESGRLYVKEKKRFGVNPDFLSKEGRELQLCIGDIFSENPKADRESFAKKERIMGCGHTVNWVMGGVLFICIAYIVFQMVSGEDILKSRGISLVQFSGYSTDYTINDALRASCVEGGWSSFREEDATYARFTGTTYGGAGINMIFALDSEGNCEIISAQIDGENWTMFAGALLEEMYSNIE